MCLILYKTTLRLNVTIFKYNHILILWKNTTYPIWEHPRKAEQIDFLKVQFFLKNTHFYRVWKIIEKGWKSDLSEMDFIYKLRMRLGKLTPGANFGTDGKTV